MAKPHLKSVDEQAIKCLLWDNAADYNSRELNRLGTFDLYLNKSEDKRVASYSNRSRPNTREFRNRIGCAGW